MEKKAPGDRMWNRLLPPVGSFLSLAGLLSGIEWIMFLCAVISFSLIITGFTVTVVSWRDDALYRETEKQREQLAREKLDLERELRYMQSSISSHTECIDRLERSNITLRRENIELQLKLQFLSSESLTFRQKSI